jgi:hypothetical protein
MPLKCKVIRPLAPLGLGRGAILGQGDTYEAALADVRSAIAFHIGNHVSLSHREADGSRTPPTVPHHRTLKGST